MRTKYEGNGFSGLGAEEMGKIKILFFEFLENLRLRKLPTPG
jgi:hypothetical protein